MAPSGKYRWKLPIEIDHCGNRHLRTFFAPVTLTLIRWPSYTNCTRIPTRYRMCEYELPTFESYRLTDRQTGPKLDTTPLWGWSDILSVCCVCAANSPCAAWGRCDQLCTPAGHELLNDLLRSPWAGTAHPSPSSTPSSQSTWVRCSCVAGYRLMPDGHTCRVDSGQFSVSFRPFNCFGDFGPTV